MFNLKNKQAYPIAKSKKIFGLCWNKFSVLGKKHLPFHASAFQACRESFQNVILLAQHEIILDC